MISNKSPRKVRGIYLLPNLLSTGGLFFAFYAIVAALQGKFELAAIAIFVAMVFDLFDGRVARMTGTESDFGQEYDSLCDMVSFGLAPALVTYSWCLQRLGKLGWLVAFMFTATTALRLARFNTQIGSESKEHFQGLPSPSAAGIVAGLVWYLQDLNVSHEIALFVALITAMTAVLMVSNIRYCSFKNINLRGKVPFMVVVIIVLIYIAISINPPAMLLLGFSIYGLSGPVVTLVQLRRRRKERKSRNKK